MRVLVTGASGRIGSQLVRVLLDAGHDVNALVLRDDPNVSRVDLPGVRIFEGGVGDGAVLAEAVRGVRAVCHLAGALTSRGNTDDEFFEVNLRGTFNLLMAVREHTTGLDCFAYASSDAVYADRRFIPAFLPIDETHPRVPGNVYGVSKVGAEELCLAFRRGWGVPVVLLRFGATADASELLDPHGTFASLLYLKGAILALTPGVDRGLMRLVQTGAGQPSQSQLEALRILRELDDGDEKLLIQHDANDHPVMRHIVDVRDLVDGVAAALSCPAAIGEAFNLGAPAPFALDELIRHVSDKTGLRYVTASLPTTRPSWYLSSAKARAVFGYAPKRTVFDMIDDAVAAAPSAPR